MILAVCGAANESRELRIATFDAAWSKVGETYYDPDFRGLDWTEVGHRYRAEVENSQSMAEVRSLITKMLYELGDSHLALLTSVSDKGKALPWGGAWAGVDLCSAGEQLYFYRVEADGVAFAAGVRDGDRLLAVNGVAIDDFWRSLRNSGAPDHVIKYEVVSSVLSRFRSGVGDRVEVQIESPEGAKRTLSFNLEKYEGRSSEPLGNIGRLPIELETRELSEKVGYLRYSLWFPAIMPDIRSYLSNLSEETDGLIIDLRGNPGGLMFMAGGLAGMLLDQQETLGTTTMRSGHINVVGFPQKRAFLGKVAVLVNESTLSTSEVFTIGLQELGRVRVFGQPTPGAALPSMAFSLPNGDALQIAMGDFMTPGGNSLEGRGVVPDEVVPISPVDLSRGHDTVLEVALHWINSNE
ncbi:S41 family peptidase [Pelagicoccus albus]|uniref:Tail specific protease domain-containing protein n=1 Tax=Pelagicoccus albus TaxID=415222 RepID=A0A7X1B8L8_9BACT|nr:hypothetical protein [Pelagicoccus albus]